MTRKLIVSLLLLFGSAAAALPASTAAPLPDENGTAPAVESPWFPGRQYAFVWRNWTLVPARKLAEVLETPVENVRALAESMGLPPQRAIEPEWNSPQGYITVLRRNWHLLPYDQLLTLLGITREELAWRLIEDDYLFVKLGYRKPYCPPLHYEKPSEQAERQAARIAAQVRDIRPATAVAETPRFAFIDEFSRSHKPARKRQEPATADTGGQGFALRIIYPYCATFGDPLTDPELSSYPEGLLQRLSEAGVNGIWMHSVLRTLVPPDGIFPGADDAGLRIEGLKRLVERAAKYGIGIYLYVNEPRAMNLSFFESDPQRKALMGSAEGDQRALCTSVPEVLDWTSRSLESVFRQVPGLSGVFTITASENLTNCASRGGQGQCERCRNRSYADLIVEVNTAIEKDVRSGSPDAKVLVWDWGWNDSYAEEIIGRLPKSCWLMSVSEWALPIERGGIRSAVGEYALSAVGPGPRALAHWRYAKQAGLKTVAKIQVNASWEMAVVPAVPVLELVAQHAENLTSEATDGVMLSWSLGGYPSTNLELFQSFRPGQQQETCLRQLAEKHYGKQAAPLVCRAWHLFSEAFKEFPYNGGTLYSGPQHMGPANPLYTEPTGWPASMVGIPYDALDNWRSVYPTETFVAQMQKVADGFAAGCELLQKAVAVSKGKYRKQLTDDLGRARTVGIHCASSANQARFTEARNRLLTSTDRDERRRYIDTMRRAAEAEAELTADLLPIVRNDPTIGYESSNHYFYVPQDLLEKQLNIRYVLDWLDRQAEPRNSETFQQ